MTLFEYTQTPHKMWVVTSPYIPELVTQASNKSEMYTRLAEAINLVLKKRRERGENLVLNGEPPRRAYVAGTSEKRELIGIKSHDGQIEFCSAEIPQVGDITGYNEFDSIQKLSDVLSQLSQKM